MTQVYKYEQFTSAFTLNAVKMLKEAVDNPSGGQWATDAYAMCLMVWKGGPAVPRERESLAGRVNYYAHVLLWI